MYNSFLEYLKSNNPEDVLSNSGVKVRQFINPIIRKVAPLTGPYKLVIDGEVNIPKDKPVIYAPTHGFKDDLLYTIMTIQDHGYVLFGSIPQFYNTFDGITAWLNGSLIVDRKDPESRKAAKPKMEKALDLGSNIIMFPEGVWNRTADLLALKLFPGIYDVATKKEVLVVPIATHVDNGVCYSKVGHAIDLSKYDRKEGLIVLRDAMATLKWELIEKYSHAERSSFITDDKPVSEQWQDFVDRRIAEVAYYDVEVEDRSAYVDKNEISEDAVFGVFDNIEMTKENAHVLSKVRKPKRY